MAAGQIFCLSLGFVAIINKKLDPDLKFYQQVISWTYRYVMYEKLFVS